MKPSILIGIVTRNRAEILPKAISSALSQRGCSLRVVVINDASTDKTKDLALKFTEVQWIDWQIRQGHIIGRNYLMNMSGSDYFVSLDDDAWFIQGDEIALAVGYLEQNQKIAAVSFDILSP